MMSFIPKELLSKRMWLQLTLGFSSGTPLLATGSTLQAWMTDSGVDLALISLYSLVSQPYSLKFLWAPVFDAFKISKLGRRRGWMLTTQLLLALSLAFFAFWDPAQNPIWIAACAFLVAFTSASQDIVCDAYRRDILQDNELGLGSAVFVNGYRLGLLFSGAFALSIADSIGWSNVYLLLAASTLVGIASSLYADEPKHDKPTAQTKTWRVVIDSLKGY